MTIKAQTVDETAQAAADPKEVQKAFSSFADFEKAATAELEKGAGAGALDEPPQPTDAASAAAPNPDDEDGEDDDQDQDDGDEEVDADGQPVEAKDDKPAKADAPADGDDEHKDVPGQPKKWRGRARDRIGQLTREKHEAARREAEKDAELADLRAKLNARQEAPAPARTEPEQRREAPTDDGRPDPAKYKFGEFDTAFTRDMDTWREEQIVKKVKADLQGDRQAQAEANQMAETKRKADTALARGVAEIEGFEDVVLKSAKGPWSFTQPMAELVLDYETSAEIMFYLADNPDEANKIAAMPPVRQGAALAKLDARFSRPTDTTGKDEKDEPPKVKGTNAPEPPQQRTRGTRGGARVRSNTQDFAAFEAMVNAQQKG